MGNITEKHVKMTVLDNQAKIQQVQPKYREVKRKSHLEFSETSVYKISLFGSRGVRKYRWNPIVIYTARTKIRNYNKEEVKKGNGKTAVDEFSDFKNDVACPGEDGLIELYMSTGIFIKRK